MSIFTLAISCLIMSNLPWFMDLTFQVPMQYCSLQQQTFTTRHIHNWASFLLWPSASFFLDLLVIALCSSPVEHWTSYNPRGSSSSVIYFAFSYCSWGSHDENTGVVCHSLLQWTFCQNFSLWPILGGLAHSFIELCQPLHHNKAIIHEGHPKRRHLGKWQPFLKIILVLL